VTLYEEQLPAKAWQDSVIALKNADLFIIWGTSLTVYPANTLIQYYGWNKIVIINRDSTTQDRFADILFHENLGKVFGEIKI
jgi:NAD-dependent deacetylase